MTENEYKQLDLPGTVGNFEEMYNFMNLEIKKDKRMENKIGTARRMSEEEKKISFLNTYFIYKKVRHINEVPGIELEIEEKPSTQAENEEINELDAQVEQIEQETIAEKSKKLAEKYMKESDNELVDTVQTQPPSVKIKLNIDEKLRLADEAKKTREAEKERLKLEKKESKLAEKESKKKSKQNSKKPE